MRVAVVVLLVAGCAAAASCLTTYNQYRLTPLPDAPAVEKRPDGCNVEVLEEGQKLGKASIKLAHVVLEWPRDKIKEQGAAGAMKTLQAAACENGAFAVVDMRALPTAEQGLVYEADLVTLAGDDGRPVNPKQEKAPPPPPAPAPSGW